MVKDKGSELSIPFIYLMISSYGSVLTVSQLFFSIQP